MAFLALCRVKYRVFFVVDYDDEAYAKEVERLKAYESTEYIGYYSVTEETTYDLLAINAVFIVDNTFRIILYSVLGVITFDGIKQALILLPVALIGLFLGIKSASILDEKIAKHLVIVLLIISGIILISKNI